MHLAELVRLAFIAATATSDQLKLEGLKTLQVRLKSIRVNAFKSVSHIVGHGECCGSYIG